VGLTGPLGTSIDVAPADVAAEIAPLSGNNGPLSGVSTAARERRGTLNGGLSAGTYPTAEAGSAVAGTFLATSTFRPGCVLAWVTGSGAISFGARRRRPDVSVTMSPVRYSELA
jgi:hypothetical protein